MGLEVTSQHHAQVEEFQRRNRTSLFTILFTDIVDSTALKQRLGDWAGAALFDEHHRLVRQTLVRFAGAQEIETAGDSFLIVFATPSDAVHFALLIQAGTRALSQRAAGVMRDRIGIHVGEVMLQRGDLDAKPANLYGIQIDTCARVMSLANGGQILVTRAVFDSARQVLKGETIEGVGRLEWINHGRFLLKGLDEPVEICEVREAGQVTAGPLASSEKAQRQTFSDGESAAPARAGTGPDLPPGRGRLEKKLAKPSGSATGQIDLSRMRHELRTPINHILGYCELLLEEGQLPGTFGEDLHRIHAGGRQLQALIAEHFDEETFFEQRDLHQLYHELRTPVNQIIGYSELLREQAQEQGILGPLADLEKIRDAAANWLALMEAYLIDPCLSAGGDAEAGNLEEQYRLTLNLGLGFQLPPPASARTGLLDQGSILVVDDDEASRTMLARRLRRYGYTVSIAPGGIHALSLSRVQPFDLVLLDMIMPGLDGFQVLAKFKADPRLRDLPIIMLSSLDDENGIARAIELGAEDYLAKPFNPIFLRARIGACLEKKRLRDKERAAHEALEQSQKRLLTELARAAGYVRSLLPEPLSSAVQSQWCFQPCEQLGGDAFGHHWVDPEHLAIYLLDVCGHGMGPALLSVSVLNVIRNQGLLGVDFREPAQVLAGLNRFFPMERQNNLFFTIWYGVYRKKTQEVAYASGGHPPALLLPSAEGAHAVIPLTSNSPAVGCLEDVPFASQVQTIPAGSRLLVFSDGVYEIMQGADAVGTWEEFRASFDSSAVRALHPAEHLTRALARRGASTLEDDFSMLELRFP